LGKAAAGRKSILSGLGWGTLAVSVSVPVRALVYGDPVLSLTHVTTFAVVGVATAAATFYSNYRRAGRTSS
jgi:hypothetical protein